MLGENSSKALSELSSRQLRCAKQKGRAYDGQVHLDSQPQPTVKPMIRMALPDYSVITTAPLFVLNLDRIPASGLPASDFNCHRAISPSGTLGRYGTDGWLPRVNDVLLPSSDGGSLR
jgi:hypothetical protein